MLVHVLREADYRINTRNEANGALESIAVEGSNLHFSKQNLVLKGDSEREKSHKTYNCVALITLRTVHYVISRFSFIQRSFVSSARTVRKTQIQI